MAKIQKLIGYFQNRSFSKNLKAERTKKYLYQSETPNHGWIHFYNKARRGAYFRPMYSTYTKNKISFKLSFGFIGITLISSCLYIVIASPYFQIAPSRVIIERSDMYSDVNIAYKAIEPLYTQSLWTLDHTEVQNLIQGLEKNIEKVEVTHLLPNSLKIIITSSPPKYSVDFPGAGRSYLLSANGILIPNRNKESQFPRLQIYSTELLESSFLDYKEAINPNSIGKIHDISKVFSVDFSTAVITSEVYYSTENELHILLENGIRIMFVLDNSLEKQLLSLKLAIEQTPGLLTSPDVTYVDSRIVGKIFVCKPADICKRNLIKIYGNSPY
ncbi:MAG: hypothetical protein PHU93_02235 [Candidatus Gracilibacteria bacterium]|nr:hypothetical protein [Candidatus Gracilibacteria bacterium]